MGNHQRRALSETDLKFPRPSRIDQLTIYVDAAHATNVNSQRSIDGHIAILVGAAVTYSAKWHHFLSTSYTETEFIQATSTEK
eukprot:15327287-Ditylum_brightwellii.AAC.1